MEAQPSLEKTPHSLNYLSVAIIVSIFGGLYSLLFVGFDFGTYLEYNFLYADIYSRPENYLTSPAALALNATAQKWFTVTFSYFLQTPWVSLVLGIVLKAINFLVAFKIVQRVALLQHGVAFVLMIALCSLIPLSDLSGEIEFTRGAVAFTLVFFGLYYILSEKLLIGYSVCAVAILIHPLDAFCAFAFVSPGILFLTLKSGDLFRHVIRMLPLLGALGWIAFEAPSVGVVADLTVTDWYRFILTLEGDDVSLFWHIRQHWFVIVPIIVGGVACTVARPVGKMEIVFLGSTSLLIAILFLEALHVYGFSFGSLSEKFISLQFRRGLWVPIFLAFVVLARFSERADVERRDAIFISGVLVCGILFPKDLVLIVLTLVVMTYLVFLKRCGRIYATTIVLFWLLLSIWILNGLGGQINTGLKQMAFVAIALVTLVGWQLLAPRLGRGRTLIVACIFFSILKVGNNLIQDQSPFKHGEFVKVKRFVEQKEPQDALEMLLGQATSQAHAKSEVSALGEIPSGAPTLIAPTATGYTAPILSDGILSFSRWDGLVVYSRAEASKYLRKRGRVMKDPFPCPKKYGSSMACVLGALSKQIDAMSEQDLMDYATAYRAEYVMRRRKLESSQFQLIYENSAYFIYKITAKVDS